MKTKGRRKNHNWMNFQWRQNKAKQMQISFMRWYWYYHNNKCTHFVYVNTHFFYHHISTHVVELDDSSPDSCFVSWIEGANKLFHNMYLAVNSVISRGIVWMRIPLSSVWFFLRYQQLLLCFVPRVSILIKFKFIVLILWVPWSAFRCELIKWHSSQTGLIAASDRE